MSERQTRTAKPWRPVKAIYALTLFFMALTGFGQMPIYNRYYMSDIPGLGWLADFYITRNIHYLGAVMLLGLVFYATLDFILLRRRAKLNTCGWLRAAMLAAIVISGVLIVIKNFPHVHFSDGLVIALNLFHIGSVMAFLMANLVCLITKKKWTAAA